jgi:hypothetical protein
MEDRCIPWEPIPREQNQWTDVVVSGFRQTQRRDATETVTVTLFYSPGGGPEDDNAHVWRIIFTKPVGFRKRMIPDWPSATPFPRPEDRSLALWEVISSSWLKDSLPPNYSIPMHHFVIAAMYDAYEVIAQNWIAQEVRLI